MTPAEIAHRLGRESEIVGAVSGSKKPIRRGSLCKIISYAISSGSSFLAARVSF